jgi:hypothetical protein
MNVHRPTPSFGSSAETLEIMVAERKQVDGLGKTPAHPKVSHSRPTSTGGNGVCTHISIPQKE